MSESRSKLESLKRQLETETRATKSEQTDQIKSDEREIRAEIASCESQIDEIRPKIESLRDRTSDITAQLANEKAEGESIVSSLKERKKSVNTRGSQLAKEIQAATSELEGLDGQIEELTRRELTSRELCEMLREPIPVLQRLFAKP
jgi:chromosome segregation ATPase